MEVDDKAPRAVLANSGQVVTVTGPVSWEKKQTSGLLSAPLGVFDPRAD